MGYGKLRTYTHGMGEGEAWDELARFVKQRRLRAGFTSAAAAARDADVSDKWWLELEAGWTGPKSNRVRPNARDNYLVKVAHTLGVDPRDVFAVLRREPPEWLDDVTQPEPGEPLDLLLAQVDEMQARLEAIRAAAEAMGRESK